MVMAEYLDQRNRRKVVKKDKGKEMRVEAPTSQASIRIPTILSKPTNINQILKNNDIKNNSDVDRKKVEGIELDKNQLKNSAIIQSKQPKLINGTSVAYAQKVGINAANSAALKGAPSTNSTNVFNAVQKKVIQPAITMQIPIMRTSVKLIDESFNWSGAGSEMLMEQCNYLVVGVLGLQNVGKSTLMSHLAGIPNYRNHQKLMFNPQTKSSQETGIHMTLGVDMYVTQERMILLDSQSLLSISSMYDMIHMEKRFAMDALDASVEMQSIQMAAFMMSVCNVILIVSDWFIDEQIISLLKTAEMLKPLTSYEAIDDDAKHPAPHIVFVQNKCNLEDVRMEGKMADLIGCYMSQSKLNYKGLGVAQKSIGRGVKKKKEDGDGRGESTNIFMLPHINNKKDKINNSGDDKDFRGLVGVQLESFRGCHGYEDQVRSLRNKMLSLPKDLMFNKFTEKKWLQYASKAWDLVKKSSVMSEYNRLLS